MRKFQEIIESDKYIDDSREKIKTLFLSLFDKIMVENLNTGFFDDPNEWEFVYNL